MYILWIFVEKNETITESVSNSVDRSGGKVKRHTPPNLSFGDLIESENFTLYSN